MAIPPLKIAVWLKWASHRCLKAPPHPTTTGLDLSGLSSPSPDNNSSPWSLLPTTCMAMTRPSSPLPWSTIQRHRAWPGGNRIVATREGVCPWRPNIEDTPCSHLHVWDCHVEIKFLNQQSSTVCEGRKDLAGLPGNSGDIFSSYNWGRGASAADR